MPAPTDPLLPALGSDDDDDDLPGGREALERLRPVLEAIPAADVRPFRAQVPRAMTMAVRVHRSYQEDRQRFVDSLKRAAFVPEDFDDLEHRGLALWTADLDLRLAIGATHSLPGLLEEAAPLRRRLLRGAEYLWGEDEDLAAQLATIRAGHGHSDVADDLMALAALYETRLGEAEANSAVSRADVARARRVGLRIVRALTSNSTDPEIARLRNLRDRAGTWLHDGIETVRAAAGFIFRNDPERLAQYPSLFTRQSTPRKTPTPTPAPEPEPTLADSEEEPAPV